MSSCCGSKKLLSLASSIRVGLTLILAKVLSLLSKSDILFVFGIILVKIFIAYTFKLALRKKS